MNIETFFKPTNIYKEYMILDLIDKNNHITQREMASFVGISLAMINLFLDNYEVRGLMKRHKYSSKTVEYILTRKGIERRKLLSMYYLKNSLVLYDKAKDSLEQFLINIVSGERKNIYLYGAGEVAEIIIDTIHKSEKISLKILGVVDDDLNKVGGQILNIPIVSIKEFMTNCNDGILISSYTNKQKMFQNLKENKYDRNKVYNYFE